MSGTFFSTLDNIKEACKEGIGGLFGSSVSLAISERYARGSNGSLVLCKDNQEASEVLSQLRFFSDLGDKELLYIPETEVLPYDTESPNNSSSSLRIEAFNKIADSSEQKYLIVTTAAAAAQFIMDFDYWNASQLNLKVGNFFPIPDIELHLKATGYKRAELETSIQGDYLIINRIIDIYPVASKCAYRIVLDDDDCIQSIRSIDVTTQLTKDTFDAITVLQAREIPCNKDYGMTFRKNFRKEFHVSTADATYSAISSGEVPDGIEFYTYLFEQSTTLLTELSEKGYTVFLANNFAGHYTKLLEAAHQRFDELSNDVSRKVLHPTKVWLDSNSLISTLKQSYSIYLTPDKDNCSEVYDTEDTGFSKKHSLIDIIEMVTPYVKKSEKTIFVLHSEARADQIQVIAKILHMKSTFANKWSNAEDAKEKAVIVYSNMNKGYYDHQNKLLVVTEREIFGMPIQASIESNEANAKSSIHDFIKSLEIGDLLVHTHYGVGRYAGLKLLGSNVSGNEYLTIEYQEDASAFVQMTDLHLVNKYNGLNPESVTIGKFDAKTNSWKKEINSVVEDIEGTALTLIEAHLQREQMVGIQLPEPKADYYRFCREFPYQATNDQLQAVSDIKADLTSTRPMDRLVAGDVGFGKTEVALRAAMIAASAGTQVVMVAPSTILAHQHFKSFEARFSNLKIKVCELTSGSAAQDKVKTKAIEDGEYQIIIGTHKAIRRNINYKNLSLVIIDEEHRFGVKDKDDIRRRFSGVNILAMTATPIPRTLNMSLTGIKDTSTLKTPPANRLNIRTIVNEFSDSVLLEAIKREVLRDGQLFFLHNNTTTIYKRAEQIQKLYPDLRIAIAHGKMDSLSVERIMADFHEYKYDMLIATTIIENGIDVPNANTILIENSDKFGLASLHQLRGRVGRALRQGYAYLLLPQDKALAEQSEKRLRAMEKTAKIGEGYKLASHDLEIRGAGELLGEKQSGHISSMGYDLYHQILTKCVNILKESGAKSLTELQLETLRNGEESIKIDIGFDATIPDKYMPHPNLRLYYYRRINMATKEYHVTRILDELEDRFGKAPEAVRNLITIARIRLASAKHKLIHVHASNDGGGFVFSKYITAREPLIDLFVKDPEHMEITAIKKGACVNFTRPLPTIKNRLDYIDSILN